MSQKLIVCLAESRPQANRIVGHLINAGFANDAISVLLPEMDGSLDAVSNGHSQPSHVNAVKTGIGVLGGAFVWLTGTGILSVPGFGSLIIAGAPLISAIGRPKRDGVTAALASIGLPETDAACYEERIRRGNMLISASVSGVTEMIAVKRIMQALDAQNIAIAGGEDIPSADAMIEATRIGMPEKYLGGSNY